MFHLMRTLILLLVGFGLSAVAAAEQKTPEQKVQDTLDGQIELLNKRLEKTIRKYERDVDKKYEAAGPRVTARAINASVRLHLTEDVINGQHRPYSFSISVSMDDKAARGKIRPDNLLQAYVDAWAQENLSDEDQQSLKQAMHDHLHNHETLKNFRFVSDRHTMRITETSQMVIFGVRFDH